MLLHGACPAPTFRKFSALETPVTAPLQRPKTTTKGGNFVKLFRGFDPTARLFRAPPSPAERKDVLTLSGKRFVVGERSKPSPAAYALFNLPRFFRGPLDLGRLIPWRRRRVNSDMLYRPIIVTANLPQPCDRTGVPPRDFDGAEPKRSHHASSFIHMCDFHDRLGRNRLGRPRP